MDLPQLQICLVYFVHVHKRWRNGFLLPVSDTKITCALQIAVYCRVNQVLLYICGSQTVGILFDIKFFLCRVDLFLYSFEADYIRRRHVLYGKEKVINHILCLKKKFENTISVVSSRKSKKHRQNNGQKKRKRQNYKQWFTKHYTEN